MAAGVTNTNDCNDTALAHRFSWQINCQQMVDCMVIAFATKSIRLQFSLPLEFRGFRKPALLGILCVHSI
jgi:hypothetical protein